HRRADHRPQRARDPGHLRPRLHPGRRRGAGAGRTRDPAGEPGRAPGLPGRRLQTLIRGIHLAITVFYPNADISSARMKPRLSHGLHQQLILTPQLRQAIRLLQLSTVELEAEIAEAVASNPLLDWAEDGQDGPADAHE